MLDVGTSTTCRARVGRDFVFPANEIPSKDAKSVGSCFEDGQKMVVEAGVSTGCGSGAVRGGGATGLRVGDAIRSRCSWRRFPAVTFKKTSLYARGARQGRPERVGSSATSSGMVDDEQPSAWVSCWEMRSNTGC